jgi:Single-stranded DNA-binding protein
MPNKLIFDGRMAQAPELRSAGDTKVCKFRLLRNEHTGTNSDGSKRGPRTVGLNFTAFGSKGEAIAQHVRTGDQLIVEARIENNNYTDGEGREHYDLNIIVTDFDFGAPGEATRAAIANR